MVTIFCSSEKPLIGTAQERVARQHGLCMHRSRTPAFDRCGERRAIRAFGNPEAGARRLLWCGKVICGLNQPPFRQGKAPPSGVNRRELLTTLAMPSFVRLQRSRRILTATSSCRIASSLADIVIARSQ